MQANSLLLHEVHQASGRGNDDVAPSANFTNLRADGHAAVHCDDIQALARALALALHLLRKLTRRCEHESPGVAPTTPSVHHLLVLLEQVLDDGKRECERLSRARARTSDDVASRHRRLEHSLLDGKQAFDASLAEGVDDFVVETEIRNKKAVAGGILLGIRLDVSLTSKVVASVALLVEVLVVVVVGGVVRDVLLIVVVVLHRRRRCGETVLARLAAHGSRGEGCAANGGVHVARWRRREEHGVSRRESVERPVSADCEHRGVRRVVVVVVDMTWFVFSRRECRGPGSERG
mmetsp:Transcript_12963/g.32321  ORF Transcript_12963/g.32321 Transcript_12963/m.32321 type:complete len:292 (-) Transcript_12963:186-1061(-)